MELGELVTVETVVALKPAIGSRTVGEMIPVFRLNCFGFDVVVMDFTALETKARTVSATSEAQCRRLTGPLGLLVRIPSLNFCIQSGDQPVEIVPPA